MLGRGKVGRGEYVQLHGPLGRLLVVQDPPQVGGDGGIECRTVETKNIFRREVGRYLSYCRWVIGRNCYSNMFSIIIFLDRYVPSSDCTCEVPSGGQAHVGQSQLAGGAWDHAGYHHQSPHYEAHCAYQVYKEHMFA